MKHPALNQSPINLVLFKFLRFPPGQTINHQQFTIKMSISTLQKYKFQSPLSTTTPVVFEVESIHLEKSCTAHHSHRSEHYKIIFVEEGSGNYQIDFQEFKIEGSGIFCLSPGQVLTVESESMKSGYQIAFNREFYCVETHGKEIACNGVLFNNIHRATCLKLEKSEST